MHEVTAAWLGCGRRELGAVGLQISLVAAPVLGPPDALRALEDRARPGWIGIGDNRRIKLSTFGARDDRRRDNHPLGRVAVLEVRVVGLAGERVKPQVRVASIKAGLAAVAIDLLRPCQGPICLERPVILCAALHMLGIVSSNRHALELQGREASVKADQLCGHALEELLAKQQICSSQPARADALR